MRAQPMVINPGATGGIVALIAEALTSQSRQPGRQARPVEANAESRAPRRGLLDRVNDWFWRQEQRDIEAYLGKAHDICDLEARIRSLERGAPFPYY